ncbi:hypothetical protein DY000_02031646 [Brassica cretica]|uniref:Uncharacterized protein n=1 Tax=Brassica cretica TaxID=69181 RepID=A0ABQ7DQZ5_BRACR|nr:hypothetical protein DY000_02031646 [Brassica cretica]
MSSAITNAPTAYTGSYLDGSLLRARPPGFINYQGGRVHYNEMSPSPYHSEGGTLRVSSQKSLNPNHLGARNDLLSSNLKLARLGIPPQQHLVPPVPDLNHEDSLHQHQDQWIASPRRHRCVQAHNSASYEKDARFSSGTQHFPARAKESKRSRRTHVPATIHLWVPASRSQIPGPGSQVPYPGPESPATNLTWREDSRQRDGSFSDIQETLRVAHPRGSREQPEEVTKRHRQKENIYISSCARALVPGSLQVLKDKSPGPPREVASTPQQRSPFLLGPVTGLRTLYPADECQSSLKHQQVHLRRTLHHWEKPTWVTRPESKSCRPLKYKIKVLTRFTPKKKSEKGKQRPVHSKNAEMERLRTLVSIHPHEEVPNPTPTPTTKLRHRPLLLSLTPEFVQGATITMGMRLKAGIGLINLSMLVKTTYNPESSMQHGNSIVTSFGMVECEIPTERCISKPPDFGRACLRSSGFHESMTQGHPSIDGGLPPRGRLRYYIVESGQESMAEFNQCFHLLYLAWKLLLAANNMSKKSTPGPRIN